MDNLLDDIFEKREEEQRQEAKKYVELVHQARKEIDLADHLFNVTYNAIKDLKMLAAIEDHIIKSSFCALNSLLEYLRQKHKIEAFSTNKSVMVDLFERKVIGKYNSFELNDIHFLNRLIDLEHYMKNSTLRFKRGTSYVLALPDYSIKSLNSDIVKNHLSVSNDFVSRVEKELNNNED